MANSQQQPAVPPLRLEYQDPPSPETLFAQRVREEREARGWTQAELAERLASEGVALHPSAIAKIEDRDIDRPRTIKLDEAMAIAHVFGTTVDDMTTRRSGALLLLATSRKLLTLVAAHNEAAVELLAVLRSVVANEAGMASDTERKLAEVFMPSVVSVVEASSRANATIRGIERVLQEIGAASIEKAIERATNGVDQ